MLWRDEQRAIGELMRQDGNEPGCIGFDSFVNNYDTSFARWFATFREELQHSSTPSSARFARLQNVLAQLVLELDVDKVLVESDESVGLSRRDGCSPQGSQIGRRRWYLFRRLLLSKESGSSGLVDGAPKGAE